MPKKPDYTITLTDLALPVSACGVYKKDSSPRLSVRMDPGPNQLRISAPPTLGLHEVHVWRVNLERTADYAESVSILSPDEQTRASKFRFEADRRRYVATRALVRRGLGSYLGIEPESLRFRYSQKGKPMLIGAEETKLSFNVSHSGEWAFLAFACTRQVGVDVERVDPSVDTVALATRFFSVAEQEQLAALPTEERLQGFFRCWTRKEAYIKATGDGLSLPLHQFDVSAGARDQDALLATRPDAIEAGRWALRDLDVQTGYAAAICAQERDWRVRVLDVTEGSRE